MSLSVRPYAPGDEGALCEVINAIIAAGGTTAHETPFTPEGLVDHALAGARVLCCHVALWDGVPVGFQSVTRNPKLPPGWGDMSSFTRRDPKVPGAGRALFAATRACAKALGLVALNATIRADNGPGLGYYSAMGFVDHDRRLAVPLRDGTPVDRVMKRLSL